MKAVCARLISSYTTWIGINNCETNVLVKCMSRCLVHIVSQINYLPLPSASANK